MTYVLIRVQELITGLIGPFLTEEDALNWCLQGDPFNDVKYDLLPLIAPYKH